MSGIASRPKLLDLAWGAFAFLNGAAMMLWPRLETIPFHFIWVSLTLLYGFRVWAPRPTALVLAGVVVSTGNLLAIDVAHGTQQWSEATEVPLMSAMFVAMVWHARRRQQAMQEVEAIAESNAALLERQESFLHDVSHELRTPVTIARGHLELMRGDNPDSRDLDVALDELARIERIISRLLLLAKAERPDFLRVERIDVEAFVEEVFTRWSDVTPRSWRLGPLAAGTVLADEEALRTALDALVENAVKYTGPSEWIELRATAAGGELVIEVRDGGLGVPA
jgi:two-component system, OmpR family, sensor kinase